MKNCRVLNRDQIKILAVITMTFNHIAHVLMTPGSVLYEVFEDTGYFTAITMCFFLAEGYRYTRSKRNYIKRLFLFGLISEIPFVLAVGYFQLNIMFTLLICFLIFCVMDSDLADGKKRLLLILLALSTVICDWALFLAAGAILLKKSEGRPREQAKVYGIFAAMFWVANIPGYAAEVHAPYPLLSGYGILHGFFAALPVLVSGIVTLVLYNGKRSEKHRTFNKWFFYIYYPAHLLILWLIKQAV
ncbi:MAG: conjugal transfer protein TraX [Oscillospiraceae bacterium]|nr:conjugal transfer protein TraX [Oscillospiraceae bacterium]